MNNPVAMPPSPARISGQFPFFAATIASGIFLLILVTGVTRQTGGFFSYPIDDPYIHMQIAKTLAFHGTWGIRAGDFESASSSLLYPLLMAAVFRIFGAQNSVPLWLNILAGMLLLFFANRWLLQKSIGSKARTIVLMVAAFLMPLPVIISTGMEHCFQTLTVFLLLTAVSDWMSIEENSSKLPLRIWIYAMLVTGFRYEGLFLIAAAGLVMAFRRKWFAALQIVVAGWVPVIIFGIYSVSKGSYFLPNSVILKSNFPVAAGEISLYLRTLFNHFMLGPMRDFPSQVSFSALERILIILPLLYLAGSGKKREGRSQDGFMAILFITALLHLILAANGWFFRYEAYLMFCAAFIVATKLVGQTQGWFYQQTPVRKIFALILAGFLAAPAVVRAAEAFYQNRNACLNIFEQQQQSARFVHQFYNHSVIGAIDIGAVSFFTDAEIVDMLGLASIDITRHWKEKRPGPGYIDSLLRSKKAALVISPGKWFGDDSETTWVRAAKMEISNNFSSATSDVNLYVPDLKDKAALQTNLRRFQAGAPHSIVFTWY